MQNAISIANTRPFRGAHVISDSVQPVAALFRRISAYLLLEHTHTHSDRQKNCTQRTLVRLPIASESPKLSRSLFASVSVFVSLASPALRALPPLSRNRNHKSSASLIVHINLSPTVTAPKVSVRRSNSLTRFSLKLSSFPVSWHRSICPQRAVASNASESWSFYR